MIELRSPRSIDTLYIKEFWSLGRVENIFPSKLFKSSFSYSFYKQIFNIKEKNDSSADSSLYPDFYLNSL